MSSEHQDELFQVCLAPDCDDVVIDSLTKMKRCHDSHHNIINISQFKKRFGTQVNAQALQKYEQTKAQVQEKSQLLIKQFTLLLESVIKQGIFFDEKLSKIIQLWEANDKQQIRQYSKSLQNIWLSESFSQDYDIERNSQVIIRTFEQMNQQITEYFQKNKSDPPALQVAEGQLNQLIQFQGPPLIKKRKLNSQFDPQGLEPLQNLNICPNEFQQMKDQIKELQQQMKVQTMNITYQFSPTNKHKNISLISKTHIRSDIDSDILCLLTPSLDMKGVIQKFGFKLVKGNGFVSFGVCHFYTVKKKEWVWDYKVGGGTYMIGSNGGTFSHWDESTNNKIISFKFSVNTAVYCYFDGQKESITFKNSETQKTYQMKIKYNGEEMYPCVAMYHKDDEVELLQPIDVPDL